MNIKKLYYWLVSLISIVAIAISIGIIISNLGKIWLISDKEYLAINSYQLDNCKYEIQRKYCASSDYKKYQQCIQQLNNLQEYKNDVEKCQQEKKQQILLRRYYYLKLNLIWAISTLVVFLILFLYHYPKFRQTIR